MPNSRYGGYQYETSPRKLKPEYKPNKKEDVKKKSTTINKNKVNKKNKKKKLQKRSRKPGNARFLTNSHRKAAYRRRKSGNG